MPDINRIKLVLVEKKLSGKWLSEQLGKDPSIISKWCQNKTQPNLLQLFKIAEILNVDPRTLIKGNYVSNTNEQ